MPKDHKAETLHGIEIFLSFRLFMAILNYHCIMPVCCTPDLYTGIRISTLPWPRQHLQKYSLLNCILCFFSKIDFSNCQKQLATDIFWRQIGQEGKRFDNPILWSSSTLCQRNSYCKNLDFRVPSFWKNELCIYTGTVTLGQHIYNRLSVFIAANFRQS